MNKKSVVYTLVLLIYSIAIGKLLASISNIFQNTFQLKIGSIELNYYITVSTINFLYSLIFGLILYLILGNIINLKINRHFWVVFGIVLFVSLWSIVIYIPVKGIYRLFLRFSPILTQSHISSFFRIVLGFLIGGIIKSKCMPSKIA